MIKELSVTIKELSVEKFMVLTSVITLVGALIGVMVHSAGSNSKPHVDIGGECHSDTKCTGSALCYSGICSMRPTQPVGEFESEPEPEPQPTQNVYYVDLATIIADCDNNKLRAEQKWSGKLIKTTGFVTNIDTGILGNVYILLKTSYPNYRGGYLQCYFDNKKDLLSLNKGDEITVKGISEGCGSIGSDPTVKSCSIQ